ncbi:MAG TPA: nuclear transport factor 2 family protein [Solirubrobacterales bacterium]|jgi:uncharacterized protein (TIGR02246 family)|nr:nuclear transport factor 2 family protein [Solirubrobacterales bacterium]
MDPLAVTPQEAGARFRAALHSGDPAGAASLFARDGCLVTPDATVIRGRESIRPVLAQLVELAPAVEPLTMLVAGTVAFARERWTLGGGGDAATFSTAVLQLVEGGWKLTIADPWGRF